MTWARQLRVGILVAPSTGIRLSSMMFPEKERTSLSELYNVQGITRAEHGSSAAYEKRCPRKAMTMTRLCCCSVPLTNHFNLYPQLNFFFCRKETLSTVQSNYEDSVSYIYERLGMALNCYINAFQVIVSTYPISSRPSMERATKRVTKNYGC